MRSNPNDPILLNNLAFYLINQEKLNEAAAELTEMDDLKKDIFYQLGETLEAQGDAATAVNQYYKEIYQVDIGYKDVAAKIEKSYKLSPAS